MLEDEALKDGLHQTDQRFLVERIKPFTSHPKLESAPDSPVKLPNRLAKIAVKNQA
jgi:hypothetical protein